MLISATYRLMRPVAFGSARTAAVHLGGGVALRAAYHAARAADRERFDEEEGVERAAVIVRVPASSIVIEIEGSNYAPQLTAVTSKKKRRIRRIEARRVELRLADDAAARSGDEGDGGDGGMLDIGAFRRCD